MLWQVWEFVLRAETYTLGYDNHMINLIFGCIDKYLKQVPLLGFFSLPE